MKNIANYFLILTSTIILTACNSGTSSTTSSSSANICNKYNNAALGSDYSQICASGNGCLNMTSGSSCTINLTYNIQNGTTGTNTVNVTQPSSPFVLTGQNTCPVATTTSQTCALNLKYNGTSSTQSIIFSLSNMPAQSLTSTFPISGN